MREIDWNELNIYLLGVGETLSFSIWMGWTGISAILKASLQIITRMRARERGVDRRENPIQICVLYRENKGEINGLIQWIPISCPGRGYWEFVGS